MDYPDLMARATRAAEQSRRAPAAVLAVDEAVDLDPQQWRLLAAMAGAAGRVVLAGDADQATNAFRGGTGGTLMPMAEAMAGGQGVQVVALARSHRCRGPVLQAVQQVHDGLPMVGVPAAAVRALRAAAPAPGPATAQVRTYPDVRAEASAVAEAVRRFCLADHGLPRWQDAAVLVRSASAIGPLEQALTLAGVPVRVAESHRTVLQDPVAAVLVRALAWAAHLAGHPVPAPEPAQVLEILQSGLVGTEPAAVRAAAARLEPAERAAARAVPRRPRSGPELLAEAVAEPAGPAGPASLVRFARRLSRTRQQLVAGAPVGEALWTLWSGGPSGPGPWALRLQNAALAADAESTAAHAALDAVLALFDEADRTQARGGAAGVLAFLDAVRDLRVPAAAPRPGQRAVALMTAHAAKGGQWDFVVVAGAQEGAWPAAGGGVGLLGEELLADVDAPTAGLRSAFVADERRLFASACARARRHLLVTAVEAGERDADGGRPSRFVSDLGLPVVAGAPAPRRSTAAGVVVALRRAVTDPRTPAALAGRAAGLLHALREDPAFPGADPGRWWGLVVPTVGVRPVWPADRPLGMTVTGLAEAAACPHRWFATRVLRAVPADSSGASVGLLLHRINEAWARGELEPALDAAQDALARSWPLLPFDAPWQSEQRRADTRSALVRLLAWHRQHSDRIAFSEEPFEMDIQAGSAGTVRLRGKADLGVVMTGQGLAVLDLKSARNGPSSAEVAAHVQLAGYQRAVAAGAFGACAGAPDRPAGAGLLLPAVPDSAGSEQPKVLWQPPMPPVADPERPGPGTVAGFDALVTEVAGQMRRESFPAIPSAACRTCPVRSWCPAKQPGAVREPALEAAAC
jgi:RecB family exonuclease